MTTYKVSNFPFVKMTLGKPQALQGGGSYFTKLTIDEKPIYLQMPKCETKNGVVETKRQKYLDMMYTREDERDLAEFIESLETQCQELINVKKDTWFVNDITREDLESMMTPISRLYKSGTKILIRSYIDLDKKNNEPICRIYDEKETIRTLSDIQPNTKIIPLIHIEGIKFTHRTLDIELRIIQILILDETERTLPDEFCLIKEKQHLETSSNKENNIHLKLTEKQSENTQIDKINQQIDNIEHEKANEETEEETEEANEETEEANEETEEESNEESNEESDDEIELNCIEELPNLERKKELQEVTLNVSEEQPIKLKNKNEVYKEIYRAALEKAKHMRNVAIQAFLEAKEIKTKYMLSDLDDSEEELENNSFDA